MKSARSDRITASEAYSTPAGEPGLWINPHPPTGRKYARKSTQSAFEADFVPIEIALGKSIGTFHSRSFE
jgi:hypothetical protein